MKRLLSFSMVLLFCLTIAVPVMAAEPREYVFYGLPPISTFEDYVFLPDHEEGTLSVYEGALPEGRYDIYVYAWDSVFMSSASPLDVDYSVEIEGVLCSMSSVVFNTIASDVSYTCFVMDLYDTEGCSFLGFINDSNPDAGGVVFSESFIIKLVSVDSFVLSDYINADVLALSLDEIIGLIPIVVSVIVGYIGLRKAIAWLRGVLHGA